MELDLGSSWKASSLRRTRAHFNPALRTVMSLPPDPSIPAIVLTAEICMKPVPASAVNAPTGIFFLRAPLRHSTHTKVILIAAPIYLSAFTMIAVILLYTYLLLRISLSIASLTMAFSINQHQRK
jgi:hypothetical protein